MKFDPFRHIIKGQQQFDSFLIGFAPGIYTPGGKVLLGSRFNKFLQALISYMHLIPGTFLLFLLNLLDAILTIYWVRWGVASEGNHLMAGLLDIGDFTFLTVKIGWGMLTALVLLRWGHKRLAKYGLSVALAVYFGVMAVHVFTGMIALGFLSNYPIGNLRTWPQTLFALFM